MLRQPIVGLAAGATLAFAASAHAADPPWSWRGFYLGAHAGGSVANIRIVDPDRAPVFGGDVVTKGFVGGVQLGYNWMLSPQWLVGLEADLSFQAAHGDGTCLQSSATIIGSYCKVTPRELAALTGRFGYVAEPQGRTLLYGKAGLAWTSVETSHNPNNAFNNLHADLTLSRDPAGQGYPTSKTSGVWGWTVGAGVEYALTPTWSLAFEYDYFRFTGISLPTPNTVDVTVGGVVSDVPAGNLSGLTLNHHVARVGLNYRWGGAAPAPAAERAAPMPTPWTPGWEFEAGLRYWYSTGSFQGANGFPNVLVSRLTWVDMTGHSGELYGRLDSPYGAFVKGLFGSGLIPKGKHYDEDWGLSGAVPEAFEVTQSGVTGWFNYFTADVGYNVLQGRDHKLGLFIGYNRYRYAMDAWGCWQLVNAASNVCTTPTPPNNNGVSEIDTWHSLRVGTSAEIRLWDRLRIAGDFAYLPYVYLNGLDTTTRACRCCTFPSKGSAAGSSSSSSSPTR